MPDANRENRADTCWVYFIQAGPHGAIKIGSSVDPWKRVRELQVGHPEVLQMRGAMLGGFAMERKLHRLFRSDRLRGEWFRPSSALLAFVDAQVPEPSTRPSKERPEPPLRAPSRQGCRCSEPVGDPREGTCVLCGHQVGGKPIPAAGVFGLKTRDESSFARATRKYRPAA